MRETNFIKQNKQKWGEFEALVKQPKKDPDKLSKLFIEITDDLSYSRTFYPNRSVRVYLNNLAQEIFYSVYRTRRLKGNRFVNFWLEELPYVIYQSRKAFYLSLIIFTVAMIIGVVSSMYDPTFSSLILGEDYIQMTLENIEKGDPMGVYKGADQVGMFFGITLNNLFVDFYTFFSGLLASLGTVFIMMYNGIMVGTFQYFFIERGLFWESALVIWVHGCIEIPTIIISGASGLVLGSGLLFPGTYSRFQSFLMSARRGLKILMGVVPLTIIAGFIEGFFTRYTDAPPLLRAGFIISCLAFIAFYYIYYPWMKSRQGFSTKDKNEEVFASAPITVELNKIRGNGEVFADSFLYLKPFMFRLMGMALAFAAAFAIYFTLVVFPRYPDIYGSYMIAKDFGGLFEEQISFVFSALNIFKHSVYPLQAIANFAMILLASGSVGFVVYSMPKATLLTDIDFTRAAMADYLKNCWQQVLAFAVVLTGIFFIPDVTGWLLFLPIVPLLSVSLAASVLEGTNFLAGFRRAFSLISKQLGDFVGLSILLLGISFIFLWLPSTSIASLYMDVIFSNFNLDAGSYQTAFALTVTFVNCIMLIIVMGMYFMAGALFFLKVREQLEAPGLLQRVHSIGKKKSIYGLEQEY